MRTAAAYGAYNEALENIRRRWHLYCKLFFTWFNRRITVVDFFLTEESKIVALSQKGFLPFGERRRKAANNLGCVTGTLTSVKQF